MWKKIEKSSNEIKSYKKTSIPGAERTGMPGLPISKSAVS